MSQFDPNAHTFRLLVIRCGRLLNPAETNITTLYEQTRAKLGAGVFSMTTKQIDFDAVSELVRQIVISAGEKLYEARKRDLPLVKDKDGKDTADVDYEALYDDISVELGLPKMVKDIHPNVWSPPQPGVSRLPRPHEMKDETGKFVIPRKDCPKCGRKEHMRLGNLCQRCPDSQGGIYKSMWLCGDQDDNFNFIEGSGCGYKEPKEGTMLRSLNEYAKEKGIEVNFISGTKKALGIKTFGDPNTPRPDKENGI